MENLQCVGPDSDPERPECIPIDTEPREKKKEPILEKPPHILFILADDYGFHDIGYHEAQILIRVNKILVITYLWKKPWII